LSAPAFLAVFATVVTTSAPCGRLRSSVVSEQLSATTTIRSGGRVCLRSDAMVAAITGASL
jgi:hypothetical protein